MMPKRTKKVKVGGLTFVKKLRPPTPQEKLLNKKSRLYYRQNKAKIKRAEKLRAMKVAHNPKLEHALNLKRAVRDLVKKGHSLVDAVRIVKSKK